MKFAKVDDNGFFVEDVILDEIPKVEVDGEMVADIHYISEQCSHVLYKPKWDFVNEEWVEGATQGEIDAIDNKPQEPTIQEQIDEMNEQILANFEINLDNMGVW